MPASGGIRALEHHGESTESIYLHMPGLKLVYPASPYDAKGLLAAALEDADPVIYFEPKRLYRAYKEEVPEERYTVPIGKARTIEEGDGVTLITWGAMSYVAREGVEEAKKQGVSVEHIDLRSLFPCDWNAIYASVKKTGRAVIVHEAFKTLGFGAEICARLVENDFLSLEAPVRRVAGWDVQIPYPNTEEYFYPGKERIANALVETARF